MSKIVKDQNLTSGKFATLETSDATISTLRLPKTTTPLSPVISGYFIVNVSGVNRKVVYYD